MKDDKIHQRGTVSAFNLNEIAEAIDDQIRASPYEGSLESAYHLRSLLERTIRAKQLDIRVAMEAAKNEIALRYAKGERVSDEDLAWATSKHPYEDEE